jgi:hypothetical protein
MFSCKSLPSFKQKRYVSRSLIELGWPPYTYPYTCTSCFKSMTFFLLGSLFLLYNICTASMFSYSFLPELHINFFEVGKKKAKSSLPWWGSKNTIYWVIWEYYKRRRLQLCFVFKNLKTFLQLTWLKEKGDLFKLFHSSTAQSFMVDTLNPTMHVWLEMVLCWCLVPRLS